MDRAGRVVDQNTSDGYHTFGELYEHRTLLFLALCLLNRFAVAYKKDHYDGWDVVYLETKEGQISYHVPTRYREVLEQNFIHLESHPWDGHTSTDVIRRLTSLLGVRQESKDEETANG